jgi:preprotein translocase subunit SecE
VSDITTGNAAAPERRTPRAGQVERRNVFSRLGLWWRQIVAELRKVIWPTRKELVTYTTVVIAFVMVVILYVTVLDYGFSKAVFAVFG